MSVHATSADYLAWTGQAPDAQPPANIEQLLRSASGMVDDATFTAVYDVDGNGDATDQAVIDAMRDATTAQAAAWVAAKIDPLAGGVITSSVKTSKSLDGASITYADAAQAAASRAAAVDFLVPEAQRILARAGLLSGAVWAYG